MKKYYFLVMVLCLITSVNAQIIDIPDANFKAKLLAASPNNQIAIDTSGLYGVSFKIDVNDNGEIEQSEALQVRQLNISGADISSLEGISYFTSMIKLDCFSNKLQSLNLSGLNNLAFLFCSKNQFTKLDLSGLNNLTVLDYSDNQLTELSLNDLSNLTVLTCSNNQLTELDLSGLSNLTELYCSNNQLTELDLSGLSNLKVLTCPNNKLTELDLSNNSKLTSLHCMENNLNALNVSGLSNLIKLDCSNNQLKLVELTGLPKLNSLKCNFNQLTTLNTSGLSGLMGLYCSNNQLTSINLSSSTKLSSLRCPYNQLEILDVSSLINLNDLFCDHNQLITLDISNNPKISFIYCAYNQLTSLSIKNGKNEFDSGFNNDNMAVGNSNLNYVCADDDEIIYLKQIIANCVINSYCSFTPGGNLYTISGVTKLDIDNNGCNENDIVSPNLKFNIKNGTQIGSLISNISGNYFIPVLAGTHTITPILENPNYFTISPTSKTVTFPTETSPFIQDFCIKPNGPHPDLEIMVLPIGVAIPGFDAKYKIVYKNKGNQTQSGSINFAINDAVLDFVSANPTYAAQAINYFTWDFSDLLPFETREIEVVLNLNSPLETPPVDSGFDLKFTASIVGGETEETQQDNTFVLNQTVVNSKDPNDKTCLEGETITPEMIGSDVHYMIRFENTGTYPAQNIVVKDMIDLDKFDVSSLLPIRGSHEFVTRITEGNKVEFIFENINLPFDDANNDGYVAFKIKTRSTLKTGDSFSNTASIYFDYNFPIVTNTATTTIAVLNQQDFEFSKYFSLYPNPTASILNLDIKKEIEVKSVNVYNTLGQLIIVIPNAQQVKAVDVSSLAIGNYFIKLNTEKGSVSQKFIKK